MVTAKQAASIHKRAEAFFAKRNAKDLEACRMMHVVRESHRSCFGYGGWRSYVEQNLGLCKREAERMVLVWNHFGVRLKGLWEHTELASLGLSKLRVLVRLTDEDNVEAWAKRAVSMTYSQLDKAANQRTQQSQPDEDKPAPEFYQEVFELTKGELDTLQKVLSLMRGESKERRKGALLNEALVEWLDSYKAPV